MVKESTKDLILATVYFIVSIVILMFATVDAPSGHYLLGSICIYVSIIYYIDYKIQLKKEEKPSSKEGGIDKNKMRTTDRNL